jgi:hypothetical protein
VTKARVEKARRKVALMNWQLRTQIPEFRPELEQCLVQTGLAGSQFMYMVWDERKRRPTATYWPGEKVIMPSGASSALTAERLTQIETISQRTYEQRVETGYYIDPADSAPANQPDQSSAEKAAAKVEGVKEPDQNLDGLREIWRVYTELELDEDPETKGELAPYIIEMTKEGGEVKRVVRNWEEKDEQRAQMAWLIEFPFLPWRGALSVGLGHIIGGLSGAATGALRALLDSAHINNFPAALKLKGANASGQSKQVDVGTLVEIEGGITQMDQDIRKLVMAFPYNPPSAVLFQLLGFLGEEAEAVVQTTLKNLQEAASSNLPVGTTLALIEQGMKVMAGIHLRLLNAMTQLIGVLHRIDRLYITDAEIKDDTGEVLASREDFNGPIDVIPVADPNIFSDAQRFAQMQIVADRAMQLPQIYDQRKVEELILERTRIPDAKNLLVPLATPQPDNAVNENAAMSMGRPVAAFPEQDHLAHLQVHFNYFESPVLGSLPIIAKKFVPSLLDHMVQHLALWYVEAIYEGGNQATQQLGHELSDLMHPKDTGASAELDRLLATLSPHVTAEAQKIFQRVPEIIQRAQALMQQLSPQPPPDTSMAAAALSAQTATAIADKNAQTKVVDIQSRTQLGHAKIASDQQTAAQKLQAAMAQQAKKDEDQAQMQAREQASREAMNVEDNETALTISAADIAAGKKSPLSTGHGLSGEKTT